MFRVVIKGAIGMDKQGYMTVSDRVEIEGVDEETADRIVGRWNGEGARHGFAIAERQQ